MWTGRNSVYFGGPGVAAHPCERDGVFSRRDTAAPQAFCARAENAWAHLGKGPESPDLLEKWAIYVCILRCAYSTHEAPT